MARQHHAQRPRPSQRHGRLRPAAQVVADSALRYDRGVEPSRPTPLDPAAHAQEILDQGFTVFERAFDEAWVDATRAEILADYEALGRPPLWSRDSQQLGEDVIVCMAGLTVHGLLPRYPERGKSLMRPEIIEVFRRVLGDDMHMEVAGWVISDKRRPFFDWHIHADGQDDSYHLERGFWPKIDTVQRLMALLYLDDLDNERGPLLIHPHTVGDPLDPPYDTGLRDWDGQVELELPRGTLIAIDQCTWHAVRQQLSEGPRIWICCTFASHGAPRCGWFDERLLDYESDDPVLQSVLPRA